MQFIHVGLLTPSLEKSIAEFSSFPGFEDKKWTIREVEFPPEAVLTGRGSHMRTAIADLNGAVFELIEPLDPASYHSNELRRKGPGLHHTAFICLENQAEAVRAPLDRGGKIVWEADYKGKHPIYVESADGTQVWEFINYVPGTPE